MQRYQVKHFRMRLSEQINQENNFMNFLNYRHVPLMENLILEFEKRFQDFRKLESKATFMRFPFGTTISIEEISTKISIMCQFDISALKLEILDLKNDLDIKSRVSSADFWNLLAKDKYCLLRKCAIYLTLYFGST